MGRQRKVLGEALVGQVERFEVAQPLVQLDQLQVHVVQVFVVHNLPLQGRRPLFQLLKR